LETANAKRKMKAHFCKQVNIYLEAFLLLRITCLIIGTCESIQADKVVSMRNRRKGFGTKRSANQLFVVI